MATGLSGSGKKPWPIGLMDQHGHGGLSEYIPVDANTSDEKRKRVGSLTKAEYEVE